MSAILIGRLTGCLGKVLNASDSNIMTPSFE